MGMISVKTDVLFKEHFSKNTRKNLLYQKPWCVAYHLTGALDKIILENAIKKSAAVYQAFTAETLEKENVLETVPFEYIDLSKFPAPREELKTLIQSKTAHYAHGKIDELQPEAFLFRLKEESYVFLLCVPVRRYLSYFYHSINELYRSSGFENLRELITFIPNSQNLQDYISGNVLQLYASEDWERLQLPYSTTVKKRSLKGTLHKKIFSYKLYKACQSFAKKEKVNIFTLVLAVFQLLLYRYTGQNSLLTTLHHGNAHFMRHLDTLSALKLEVDGGDSFKMLLYQLRDILKDKENHTFFRTGLIEKLGVENYLTHPLAQVNFRMEKEENFLLLPDINAIPYLIENQVAPYELALSLIVCDNKLELDFLYANDLFSKLLIERLSGHVEQLLEEVVANPNKAISQYDILTAQEKKQILIEWNATDKDYSKDKTIHQLFEEQVEKTPNNVAILFEDQSLTYQELNANANQLAHYLREKGVKADTLVAIVCERSLEMVIGILGILKAGGAYVPIDPSYPQDRIQFMLEDAQAPLLLTQQDVLRRLPTTQAKVFLLDKDQEKLAHYQLANPFAVIQSHHLAYVIYTSGSTGKPKGVMVEHRSVINLLQSIQRVLKLTARDCWLALTTITFDIAGLEIYLPLITGASIALTTQEGGGDPEYLKQTIQKRSISIMQATPSTWHMLLDGGWKGKEGLKILTGGEALSLKLFQTLKRLTPYTYNVYGPTETTIWSASFHVGGKSLAIGRPLANTHMYILDSFLQPTPIGVLGELYIGGEGLARGYLNQPELTAERFIKNPFRTEKDKVLGQNSRLYKTGDLVRYLEDGNIEYIGRNDFQVKIRGFRIELGEIESALLTHPEVKQVVVIAREDVPGNKCLVAYVVYKNKLEESTDLFAFLKGSLPEYMVPSTFVTLEALPITPNGKLDRKALPAPEYQSIEEEYVAPRNKFEASICEVWQEVLKIQRIGVEDNFFRLGGHSLLATQVVSRLRNQCQIELPLRAFFKEPTIKALARLIGSEQREANILPLVPVVREGRLPLSFAQQRLWFIEELTPHSALYNIPVVWKLEGKLSYKALEAALNALVARHEVLRTVFRIDQDNPYQFIHHSLTLDIPWIDLCALKGKRKLDKAQTIIEEEILKPFDLTQGPLIRARLIKLKAEETVLVLNTHHSVSDGWSLGVVIRELVEVYNATVKHEAPNLKPLPIQYADFSVWQRAYLAEGSIHLQKQLHYWQEKLEGMPALLELPTDYSRPAAQSFKGSRVDFKLSPELSSRLKALSEDNSATLYMTLLAAFFTFLYRYTSQEDLVVGSPIANRNRHEVEDLVGFFVNTLVLRANLSAEVAFKDLLQQVKETTLGAYDHQDLPFERLVDSLNIERSLSYTPLFQVMFVLQNADEAELKLADINIEPMPFDYPVAKFDLTLAVSETKEGIQGSFEYATGLFKHSTIERMAKSYQRLLQSVVEKPRKEISKLEILTEKERYQLLVEWNATEKDYNQDKTIHQLFEEQVEKTPNNIAIVFEDQSLTYRELNAKANQLAHYLREKGVKADSLVAIACERSLEMIVGILGILKAGGAYVPIDPSYPLDRIQFILEDIAVNILITQSYLQGIFRNREIADVVAVDQCQKKLQVYPDVNLMHVTSPEHLAYVIYTSGSTGKPKGVLIEHKSICNRLCWWQDYTHLNYDDKFLHQFSIAFDGAVVSIFWPLIAGATIIMPNSEGLKGTEYLINCILNHSVTILHGTPSLSALMIQELVNQNVKSIRKVMLGGEIFAKETFETISKLRNCRIYNFYGPTETSIIATSYDATFASVSTFSVPIGRPVANASAYILNNL